MTVDLDTFEAKARAATPGPWRICQNPHSLTYEIFHPQLPHWEQGAIALVPHSRLATAANAKLIAACNPAAILEMCAELRELRVRDRQCLHTHETSYGETVRCVRNRFHDGDHKFNFEDRP